VRTIEDILADLQAIADLATDRALTDEEVGRYEALEKELSNRRKTNELVARQNAYTSPVNSGPALIAGGRKPDTYATAFNAYMRSGRPNADLERIGNAQSEGVPSEGGYLVPDEFRVKLVEKLKAYGGIGGVADRYTTGDGRPVEWPTIDDTGNVGEIVQEGNTFSAGADLVFGTNQLGAYSYVAGGAASTPIRISYELAQDTAFDLEGLLSRLFVTRIGRIMATHFATGSGVTQPLGLLTGLTPVQNAANTGIAYPDLVRAVHSVDPAYRGSARWVFNDLTLQDVELITDPGGSYIYRGRDANLQVGLNESTLLGYPVTIDQAMPTKVNNSPTVQWGAFGDIRQGYVVRDIKNPVLLVNPYTRMANRQIEYTMWARADATQQDTSAYVTLSGHT
jgi:HK97 family phage major capsid protein